MALGGSLKGFQYYSNHLGSMKQPLLHNPVLQGQAKSNSFQGSCKRVRSSRSAVIQRPACAQDRTAQGLTSRKGAERSLTPVPPGKGEGRRYSPSAKHRQTPGSEGNGQSKATEKQGTIPPLLLPAVHRIARQGANCERTCKPKVLSKSRCFTCSCPHSIPGPFDILHGEPDAEQFA